MLFGGVFKRIKKKNQLRKIILKLRKGEKATDLIKKGCLPACKYYNLCEKGKVKIYSNTVHHIYFPKRWYETTIERGFRELPQNKIVLCRGWHDYFHWVSSPPKKPSIKKMVKEIEEFDKDRANKKLFRAISRRNGVGNI